jgi:hypothetical protein
MPSGNETPTIDLQVRLAAYATMKLFCGGRAIEQDRQKPYSVDR